MDLPFINIYVLFSFTYIVPTPKDRVGSKNDRGDYDGALGLVQKEVEKIFFMLQFNYIFVMSLLLLYTTENTQFIYFAYLIVKDCRWIHVPHFPGGVRRQLQMVSCLWKKEWVHPQP